MWEKREFPTHTVYTKYIFVNMVYIHKKAMQNEVTEIVGHQF